LHDAVIAERANVPALAVMTSNFVDAADLMSRVLGLPDYEFAVIEHPVSSASDLELKAQAKTALNMLRRIVVKDHASAL